MNRPFFVRKATKSDLPAVLHLYAQPEMDDENVLSLPEAERILERMAGYPNYSLYVAVIDARVVGSFAFLVMDNLGHQGTPSAIIEDVVVDPDLQRRGIGKTMVRHAIQLAADHGCYKAMLSSNLKRQHAHDFYESLDFERHGYSFRINTG